MRSLPTGKRIQDSQQSNDSKTANREANPAQRAQEVSCYPLAPCSPASSLSCGPVAEARRFRGPGPSVETALMFAPFFSALLFDYWPTACSLDQSGIELRYFCTSTLEFLQLQVYEGS